MCAVINLLTYYYPFINVMAASLFYVFIAWRRESCGDTPQSHPRSEGAGNLERDPATTTRVTEQGGMSSD